MGEAERTIRSVVPPDTWAVSFHLVEVQVEGAARKAPFQEHPAYTDHPPAQSSPASSVVAVRAHKDYAAAGSGDDVASYALDEAGKRGDVEPLVGVVVRTLRRAMR